MSPVRKRLRRFIGFILLAASYGWNQFRFLGRPCLGVSLASEDSEILSRNRDLVEIGRQELQQYYDFTLDDWQLQAGGAICQGHNVIVCSATGSGKVRVPGVEGAFEKTMDKIFILVVHL